MYHEEWNSLFVSISFQRLWNQRDKDHLKIDLVANMMHLPFANWLVRESMLMLEEKKKNCMVWVLNS